jgi:hypothetical protein
MIAVIYDLSPMYIDGVPTFQKILIILAYLYVCVAVTSIKCVLPN